MTKLIHSGRVVLVLDGADELVTRGDSTAVRDILQQLSALSGEQSRLIVSCRTHWLRDEYELRRIGAEDIFDTILHDRTTQTRRYVAIEIEKLQWGQIWSFLEKKSSSHLHDLDLLFGHHQELVDLAGIPVFLVMLARIADKLGGFKRVRVSDIYRLSYVGT
jgi:hypothetical protein